MDTVLIKLPNNLYQFIQAMAVVQDYQVQMAVGAQRQQRDANYQITFRMDEKFKYFEPCLRVVHDNIPIFDYSGWDEEQRGEYDCFIRFDDNMFQRAKAIAEKIGVHIVYGLNHLIGAGATPLPVLKPLMLTQDPGMVTDVLILSWDSEESSKLYQFILNNYPDISVVVDPRDFDQYTLVEVLEYINHFNCVIGPYGIKTSIATTLKKIVVELYHTGEEGLLLGHSGTPGYWAVIGQQHTAEYLWSALWEANVCPELMSRTKSQQEQISKETLASIAVNVGEKSGDKLIPRSEQ